MIKAADTFVVYDDVNYIKGGWINRNNILLNGKAHLFTLSLEQASPFKKIQDTLIQQAPGNKSKILGMMSSAYRKAPHYKRVFPLLEAIVMNNEPNLSVFLYRKICEVCRLLGIETKIILSSSIQKNNDLSGQDKVIEICKRLGTQSYINAIGGQTLYRREVFASHEIKLSFIQTRPTSYKQFNENFVPNLSIIDLMMFCDSVELREHLTAFDLV